MARANQGGVAAAMCCKSIAGEALRHSPNEAGSWRVDASRVVFAFARDHALPGSRWWKRMHPYTRTPVNAVWLVMVLAGLCGLLGFSETALSSLAG